MTKSVFLADTASGGADISALPLYPVIDGQLTEQLNAMKPDALAKLDTPEKKSQQKYFFYVQAESDLIVVAVILGFVCTRYYLGQPYRLDYEFPSPVEYVFFDWMDRIIDPLLDGREVKKPNGENWTLLDALNESRKAILAEESYAAQGDLANTNMAAMLKILAQGSLSEQDKKALKKEYAGQLAGFQNFLTNLDVLSVVLDKKECGMGKKLLDGQSPRGREGSLITGRKGGEMVDEVHRATPLSLSKAAMIQNAYAKRDTVYQGRGAYTGLVEDPVNANNNLYPTMRVNPSVALRPWSGISENTVQGKTYWGLIGPGTYNYYPNYKVAMGPLPSTEQGKKPQIGYVHGMCTAITHCMDEGPWCNAYEMATGMSTTKIASCFACTTYMYTTGFPPSSTHLGRAESWVPPQVGERLEVAFETKAVPDNPAQISSTPAVDDSGKATLESGVKTPIVDANTKLWNKDIHEYLCMGLSCLVLSKDKLGPTYQDHLEPFRKRLLRDAGAPDNQPTDPLLLENKNLERIYEKGGALFLDALTIHDKEEARIQRAFAPLHTLLTTMGRLTLGESH